MNNTHVRKNNRFRESLDSIREYLFDERGQTKDTEFYFTIFPRPEINDYALSRIIEKGKI